MIQLAAETGNAGKSGNFSLRTGIEGCSQILLIRSIFSLIPERFSRRYASYNLTIFVAASSQKALSCSTKSIVGRYSSSSSVIWMREITST